jgi:molybdenum cofactor guanylyltransferase
MGHSAVLLAGGKSTRMGQDKALMVVQGEPLWRRQLAVLQQTQPEELLISAPLDAPYRIADARMVPDAIPDHGPLAGLVSCLAEMKTEWLLVLAVDLPFMTAEFLHSLVVAAEQSGRGVFPVQRNGRVEPLAAVYPAKALPVARSRLESGDGKLVTLLARLEGEGMMRRQIARSEDAPLFANWNSPSDISSGMV